MPCIARAGRKMEGGPTGHTATWGESGGGGGPGGDSGAPVVGSWQERWRWATVG
jgi:hypothetical protein